MVGYKQEAGLEPIFCADEARTNRDTVKVERPPAPAGALTSGGATTSRLPQWIENDRQVWVRVHVPCCARSTDRLKPGLWALSGCQAMHVAHAVLPGLASALCFECTAQACMNWALQPCLKCTMRWHTSRRRESMLGTATLRAELHNCVSYL